MDTTRHVSRQRLSQIRNPERHQARTQLTTALRKGTLTRLPCEVCQSTPAEAHHRDYTQPLAVQWLCRTHHREAHRQTRPPREPRQRPEQPEPSPQPIEPRPEGKNPHAVALGRLGGLSGGRSTSPAKQAASRANGAKGGAPKRYRCELCQEPAGEGHALCPACAESR